MCGLVAGHIPLLAADSPNSTMPAEIPSLKSAPDGGEEGAVIESETPARVIALKAWSGMGGRFTGCVREMRGNVSRPNAFCADFKDRILGWEGWRQ